ncbi:alpha-D-glcNAc alpha-1,2-L-rhamnosyltransferase [Vibrio ishigakensis]|uniref:Alpha-D-glcNAc alpha-1,2-L-rhamnosyltransferase n=1 Tax=Vibrio ishigakensis TaxID=1481914 RepID=A0A0B8QA91_9VIBR|nr:alpha-D-glcNAc alpha-1,2-L-rhamnosyltransferase [Vibrio ishigakensis]
MGWFAKKWLKLSESFAVKFSDVVVTDNKAITDYVQEEYGKSSYTIAYGGDHALDSEHSNYSNLEVSEDYYFTVCRIEPENNIEMILKSFADSKHLIKFVGNWDASEYGQNLFNTYSKYSNIELVKPIYDIKELYKLRSNCTGYIHGHSAGGTNPSLVEIMHFGKPVVAYDCSFNRYTTDDKAIYFKDSNQLTLELDRLGQDSKDLVGAS